MFMLRYGKSSSNIEYSEQNIKYKTHKMYTEKVNTTQLVCNQHVN